jgi:hypothetical protein
VAVGEAELEEIMAMVDAAPEVLVTGVRTLTRRNARWRSGWRLGPKRRCYSPGFGWDTTKHTRARGDKMSVNGGTPEVVQFLYGSLLLDPGTGRGRSEGYGVQI